MAEVLPKDLAFPIKDVKVAVFGFSEKTERYMQIEEAINRRYKKHSLAEVTLMPPAQYKRIKKIANERILKRDYGHDVGAVILPLEVARPSQYGDDPVTWI